MIKNGKIATKYLCWRLIFFQAPVAVAAPIAKVYAAPAQVTVAAPVARYTLPAAHVGVAHPWG